MPSAATDLADLRAPVFDTKRDQYVYKSGKRIVVNYFDKSRALHHQPDENFITLDGVTGKNTQWSPQGTYLIVVRTEQIDFLGGEQMIPIITIPQSQVTSVKMSPCENYVLTYSEQGENTFTVWNFKMQEIIRQMARAGDEDMDTYQWSHDGKYIAKKFRTELKKEGTDEVKIKEGISVYSLPTMEMISNREGQKKSITVNGIKDWMWVPGKNMLVYSCFFGTEKFLDQEEVKTEGQFMDPRIGFMTVPDRAQIQTINLTDSMSVKFKMNPNGKYLAAINYFRGKKGVKSYSVELFDLTKDQVPHQKIIINKKQLLDFTDLYWDTRNDMLALHMLEKKDGGMYNIDAKRHGVDIYQMTQDKLKGFQVLDIGVHPSDKVSNLSWSPAGDIFAIEEKDTGFSARSSWSFYLVVKGQAEKPKEEAIKPIIRGKGGKQSEM